ncbi:hypothetical protein ACFOQM_00955 [Paenibacillus sp. GCM10012307]
MFPDFLNCGSEKQIEHRPDWGGVFVQLEELAGYVYMISKKYDHERLPFRKRCQTFSLYYETQLSTDQVLGNYNLDAVVFFMLM